MYAPTVDKIQGQEAEVVLISMKLKASTKVMCYLNK
jgi:hypothetical protein